MILKTRYNLKKRVMLLYFTSITLFFYCITLSIFPQKSYQFYFIFVFYSLIVIGFTCCISIYKNCSIKASYSVLYMIMWGIYIYIHSRIFRGEYYQLIYLLSGIFYFCSLVYLLRNGIINSLKLFYPYCGLAVAQSVICILQHIGIMDSHNPYFKTIGTFNNPNITAMFLTVAIPFILNKLIKQEKLILNISILLLFSIALILLQCRTAWIGCIFIVSFYFLQFNKVKKCIINLSTLTKYLSLIIIIVSFSLLCIFIYKHKQASSEGRLFIWKVSIKMIKEKPFFGYGCGSFEKEYNLNQAQYFQNNPTTLSEKEHARYTYMPYNDFIELAIQGGIIGCILFITLLISLIRSSIRQGNKEITAIITTYIIMVSINFGIQAIPLWMFMLTCFAVIASKEEEIISLSNKFITKTLIVIVFYIVSISFQQQIKKANQWILLSHAINTLQNQQFNTTIKLLQPIISDKNCTPEIFPLVYAKALSQNRQNLTAINVLTKAGSYTSSPAVFIELAKCFQRSNQYEKAESIYRLTSHMVPTDFKSHYLLMCILNKTHQQEALKQTALNIQEITFRHQSKYACKCKEIVKKVLNN